MILNFGFTVFLAISCAIYFYFNHKQPINRKLKIPILLVLGFLTLLALTYNCKNLIITIIAVVTTNGEETTDTTSSFGETITTIILPLIIDIVLLIFETINFYKEQFSIKNHSINFDDLEVIDLGITSNTSKKSVKISLTEKDTMLTDLYYIKPHSIYFQLCLCPDILNISFEDYKNLKESEHSEFIFRNLVTSMNEISKYETIVRNDELKFSFYFECDINRIQDLIQNISDSNDKNSAIVVMDYRILKTKSLLHKFLKRGYLIRKTKTTFCKFTRNVQINSKMFSIVH